MFRRLITCLALITGLAATGAPANAAVIDAMSEQVSASASTQQAGKVNRCECRVGSASSAAKSGTAKRCITGKTLRVYIPTVIFGVDRAYE